MSNILKMVNNIGLNGVRTENNKRILTGSMTFDLGWSRSVTDLGQIICT